MVCSAGIGPARGGRAVNEDNYLVCRGGEVRFREGEKEFVKRVEGGAGTFLAVADGMGGHEDGDLASSAAVQAMARLYARGRPEAPELGLHRFVVRAHRRIRESISRRGPVKLGTTLSCVWILDDRVFWIHVGDSRLYHYRQGVLTCLTSDHTRGEFARRDRRPIPRDAHQLAQTFVYGSRGLGDDDAIRIDPGRDTGSFRIRQGDTILLCTDGLSAFVDEYRIAWALQEVPSPAACSEVLLERAIAQGSNDNITVMVAKVDSVGGERYQESGVGAAGDNTIVPP